MTTTIALPADAAAERIVRYFQAQGFSGISEALIIRIALRKGDRAQVEAIFEAALESDKLPPVHDCFEIYPAGHYAATRSFADARAAIQGDFAGSLRMELPRIFFDPAPVMVDDPFATGTRYDAMIKLRDNTDGYAYAILLNDPESSFMEYLGTHRGNDWQAIMGEFGDIATQAVDLLDIG